MARLWLCATLLTLGCKSMPPGKDAIADVRILQARVVDPDEILAGLATAETSTLLGLEGVLFDYEIFDQDVLARDLQRIERYYRARGYYEAKVTAARVIQLEDRHVRVEIRVEEGRPIKTAFPVSLSGIATLPAEVTQAAQRARILNPGDIFDERAFEETKQGVALALANAGHAFVKVAGKAEVDLANHVAKVAFTVEPGPVARYGEVAIQGNGAIPLKVMRDVMGIVPGARYSHEELEDARRNLVALGVFATVDLRQDTSHPENQTVPITVLVEPTTLKTVKLGGGIRFDSLRLSWSLTTGWEHKNFLGGARRFSVNTRPGLVFFPTRVPVSEDDSIEAPRLVLFDNYTTIELEQPAFLEARTKGKLLAEYNRYPLLYQDQTDEKNSTILGFNEVVSRASIERRFLDGVLRIAPSYNVRAHFPFSYNDTELRAGVDTILILYPELNAKLDFRDNPVQPKNGGLVSLGLQSAGSLISGDAVDLRVTPEARLFKDLQVGGLVLAARGKFGWLFPSNYEQPLTTADDTPTDPAAEIRNQQLMLFRGFFSGGPNSNRGYAYREVGPHAVLGFLIPNDSDCTVPAGNPNFVLPTRCTQDRPVGGVTLWELGLELRFPLIGTFSGATFIEGSDVTTTIGTMRVSRPHLSTGAGLRYETPVGPIRLDVGYRIPKAQELGEDEFIPGEGDPGALLGLPIAIHFALGEAF